MHLSCCNIVWNSQTDTLYIQVFLEKASVQMAETNVYLEGLNYDVALDILST